MKSCFCFFTKFMIPPVDRPQPVPRSLAFDLRIHGNCRCSSEDRTQSCEDHASGKATQERQQQAKNAPEDLSSLRSAVVKICEGDYMELKER